MAFQIAGMRAGETHLPGREQVFADRYAEYFFEPDIKRMFANLQWVKGERAKHEKAMPGVNGAIAARTAFIDKCVGDAPKNGTSQLEAVGAG
jgi:O-methyltransferase involved in polyketide biosynthesis